ncbi:hypothetical protein H6B15_12545 [Gemmiger formicilis]|uniref:AfsR/SARP family transcriptional regulator n=1 Tax=Gemmiger formicilis TaxID=745368 RepID=UPI001957FFD8|nr:BTAD domain-containing protein [Gemmiger formicilis]MBM6717485.1 hypothetical protein [Gemmiger formicilis]
MSQPKIQITLLGKFEITLDGRPVLAGMAQSRKIQLLVQYLLLQYGRPATHGELTTALWGNAGDADMSLRAVMHRFRIMAAKEDPILENCILTGRGTYMWNTALDCEVDIFTIRRLAEQAAAEPDADIRAGLYRDIIARYTGRLLPDSAGEPWVERQRVWLHNLYKDTLFALMEVYKEKEEYAKVVELSSCGLKADPYDERLYVEQILALESMGRTEEAEDLTRRASESGCLHGDSRNRNLNGSYKRMQQSELAMETDLEHILREVTEPGADGAYLCAYETFRSICRVQLRMRARYDFSLFLVTVSIVPPVTRPGASRTAAVMRVLENVLCRTLRSSDVVARYSDTRFVLLLGGMASDGSSPMERVRAEFYRRPEHDGYLLTYRLHTPENPPIPRFSHRSRGGKNKK